MVAAACARTILEDHERIRRGKRCEHVRALTLDRCDVHHSTAVDSRDGSDVVHLSVISSRKVLVGYRRKGGPLHIAKTS